MSNWNRFSTSLSMPLYWRSMLSDRDCDRLPHVSMDKLWEALDWTAGMCARKFLQDSESDIDTIVTARLMAHFFSPALVGDHSIVRGTVAKVGTTSLNVYEQLTAFRGGAEVELAEAEAVMVCFDREEGRTVEHGLGKGSRNQIPFPAWSGPKWDGFTDYGESILSKRIPLTDSNPLGAMFGAATASTAQEAAVMFCESYQSEPNEIPPVGAKRFRFVPRVAVVDYLAPGKVNDHMYGWATLLGCQGSTRFVGVELRQGNFLTSTDAETILRAQFAMCPVIAVKDDLLGWRWERC